MRLGTHNTMTYAKPRKWWMKLINFAAKCQASDLDDQFYKYGVDLFDIRVKFAKDSTPIIAHGLIEYDITIEEILDKLVVFSYTKSICCRILFEDNFISKSDYDRQVELFKSFCAAIQKGYTSKTLTFIGGYNKYGDKLLYDFKTPYPRMYGVHASKSNCKLVHLWPWLYSKTHNKAAYKLDLDKDTVLMLDFIEIGHE